MFFDMRGEAQFLDLLFTVSPGHSSGIRLERRRFSLPFAIRLHGGRLLIGKVHTKYAPLRTGHCQRLLSGGDPELLAPKSGQHHLQCSYLFIDLYCHKTEASLEKNDKAIIYGT
ncbi:hypothetical protein NYE41_17775 [Paenibacillus sp. FSL L8-0709]|uniref:hypothetical protein n=1 Tax=Paenibacillus sp. FSL L8-0709 TaxID=2975312 RepID=UPI0030F88009